MKRNRLLNIILGLLVLYVASAILISSFRSATTRLAPQDYVTAECSDIVREADGQLVCEVNINTEDQNLIIYKEVK